MDIGSHPCQRSWMPELVHARGGPLRPGLPYPQSCRRSSGCCRGSWTAGLRKTSGRAHLSKLLSMADSVVREEHLARDMRISASVILWSWRCGFKLWVNNSWVNLLVPSSPLHLARLVHNNPPPLCQPHGQGEGSCPSA